MKKSLYKKLFLCSLIICSGCASANVTEQTAATPQQTEKTNKQKNREKLEGIMKDKNVVLTAKDVQYNMPNSLDQKFAMSGKIELDDYYNYGFTDLERKYFVVRLTPDFPEGYSESWYIYLHRESFGKLYDTLQKNPYEYMLGLFEIPRQYYEKGQGNMAIAQLISW
ncbi:hypothetical protein [Paenibacillus sp. FJAT-26967]|uniref:hypothetical protein n=1 Tax=Paenibacillus sp. FJAT-26967 TaxID=1729690 RepID=UPI00083862A8|nr:hypothetical protein [Paenibacillus sp. FJAT-26967]